jgi:acyl dehydratase
MTREDGVTAPAAAGREVYYEDLQVGRRFTSASRPLDADAVKAFARDFDPQPFHTDEETARGTFFDGLAASGWHTAALTMRLLVESVPVAAGLIGAGVELVWPRPARPGDVLTVESEVIERRELKSKPGYGIVRLRSITRNQRGEVLQDMTSSVLAPRRA